MNCPSRVDPIQTEGWNQNPDALNADATTRADFNHIASARLQQDHRIQSLAGAAVGDGDGVGDVSSGKAVVQGAGKGGERVVREGVDGVEGARRDGDGRGGDGGDGVRGVVKNVGRVGRKYARFIGPGFMVAVAYIDPGNYATDVAAGASYRFKLLFVILMSNIFAIFLQSLCIKLGTVTGMNLAENCKAHLPPWLNYILYFFAESAIIATDIAEVIGTAIALNILLHIPLVAGCAISILDVLIILFFYRPGGTIRGVRIFEYFVMALVLGVVVCFCYQLSKVHAPVGEVFRGYLPSSSLVESQALYQACGILGATVMPHSLYLGSGIVQPRLREFDETHNTLLSLPDTDSLHSSSEIKYKPSLAAIRSCMSYSIVELAVSLFTFALFVNSAILIVAGASLYGNTQADGADLFSIHSLLARTVAPVAGTLFALALLLSGVSAGIVCTIAGQMVSEGQINWTVKPWLRRLITRSISITPSIIIAGAVGRDGLARALEGSQVALSVILPFVSAPLIWFTCRSQYMKVAVRNDSPAQAGGDEVEMSGSGAASEQGGASADFVQMRNHWVTAGFALVIWAVIVLMNGALIVLAGLGVG